MKILTFVFWGAVMCACWLLIAIPSAAVAFIFGRWCAQLLGWL